MILLEREKLLSELEQKIGYSFRSRALLDRALTHRSFANEHAGENCQHNEALEFLGDSVLGFVVSAWLLERFPDLSEGKLSKMKAYLVSESRLVEIAEALDLGSYILLNRGEEKTGGRRKRALLADAYEALIGVLYVDGGISIAERFLRRELRQKLMSIDPASMIGADYKSALQEKLQAAGGARARLRSGGSTWSGPPQNVSHRASNRRPAGRDGRRTHNKARATGSRSGCARIAR
jgi:ribonuclease-3